MRRRTLVVVVAVVSLLLTGCGGGSSANDKASTGDGPDPVLRIAQPGEPRGLNLYVTDGSAKQFLYNVYETLVTKDPDYHLQPLLATKWETQDGAWVFHLRNDVQFHDGSPLTADDVVASLQAGKKAGLGSTVLSNFEAAQAIDDYTVKVVSKVEDDPSMVNNLTEIPIAPSELTTNEDDLTDKAVGTGPYKFAKWNRGSDIELTRNDAYWGSKGTFSGFTVRFLPEESARLNAVRAGEVDIALNLSLDLAEQAPAIARGPLSEVLGIRLRFFKGTPLEDARLRQAVNMAIDRESILKNIIGGQAGLPKGQQVISQVPGFNPDVTDWPYDPAQAKQIVQQTGAAGTKLTLSIPQGRFAKERELGQAVVQMIDDIGFKVAASYDDPTKFGEKVFAKPAQMPDMLIVNNSNEIMDSAFTLNNFKCEGLYPGGCDEQYTAAVNAALKATTLEERDAHYKEAWKLFRDHGLFISLSASEQQHGIGSKVEWKPRLGSVYFVSDITFK